MARSSLSKEQIRANLNKLEPSLRFHEQLHSMLKSRSPGLIRPPTEAFYPSPYSSTFTEQSCKDQLHGLISRQVFVSQRPSPEVNQGIASARSSSGSSNDPINGIRAPKGQSFSANGTTSSAADPYREIQQPFVEANPVVITNNPFVIPVDGNPTRSPHFDNPMEKLSPFWRGHAFVPMADNSNTPSHGMQLGQAYTGLAAGRTQGQAACGAALAGPADLMPVGVVSSYPSGQGNMGGAGCGGFGCGLTAGAQAEAACGPFFNGLASLLPRDGNSNYFNEQNNMVGAAQVDPSGQPCMFGGEYGNIGDGLPAQAQPQPAFGQRSTGTAPSYPGGQNTTVGATSIYPNGQRGMFRAEYGGNGYVDMMLPPTINPSLIMNVYPWEGPMGGGFQNLDNYNFTNNGNVAQMPNSFQPTPSIARAPQLMPSNGNGNVSTSSNQPNNSPQRNSQSGDEPAPDHNYLVRKPGENAVRAPWSECQAARIFNWLNGLERVHEMSWVQALEERCETVGCTSERAIDIFCKGLEEDIGYIRAKRDHYEKLLAGDKEWSKRRAEKRYEAIGKPKVPREGSPLVQVINIDDQFPVPEADFLGRFLFSL